MSCCQQLVKGKEFIVQLYLIMAATDVPADNRIGRRDGGSYYFDLYIFKAIKIGKKQIRDPPENKYCSRLHICPLTHSYRFHCGCDLFLNRVKLLLHE